MQTEASTPQQGSDTRDMMVRIAHKLFMEYGYRSVSTRKIADACGLTQPALYHHFPNKEAIYLEVLRRDLGRTREALVKMEGQKGPTADTLYDMAYFIIVNSPENMSQMFQDIRRETSKSFQEKINNWWHEAYRVPISIVFQRGIDRGELRDPAEFGEDADKYVCLMVNMISRSIPSPGEVAEGENDQLIKKRASFVVEVLLNGVSSR
ncbi:TetR/AcrR family transcriptional regulator [Alteribacter natronophilus]|uniref:TetR/AcrR family transcriptional regulator n=1 Tax=Alteribacter natronophilus TaxID=2583810 RepID=UPI00110E5F5F|nr:TetR/AcrR family transcriptional regulator [Alteribacter natronophilus]TMW70867.1 TetR/AcrR family transcriptional regulator [Alteribacter natronophilus]